MTDRRINPLHVMDQPYETRAEAKARRSAGVDARNRRKEARLTVTCRYINLVGEKPPGLCTAEAVDRDGEILLCTRHLALTLELLRSRGFYIEAPHGV